MKSFLYLHCSDLERARRFYSNVLGLPEIYFSADEGSVGYQAGSLQLTIGHHDHAQLRTDWARQLGWSEGTSAEPSWGFHLEADQFHEAVERTRAGGVKARFEEPRWVGYRSFPVMDPMGNTVEVSATDRDAWPAS